jgi:hypothetical protein
MFSVTTAFPKWGQGAVARRTSGIIGRLDDSIKADMTVLTKALHMRLFIKT